MVATETRHQGASCRDSCVEFFFTPGADPEPGYFNIEMTCVGATLFHHQREPGVERVVMDDAALESLQLRHSLAGPVIDPERVGPQTCTVGYRVPFAILRNGAAEMAAPASPPVAGSVWRANFYKWRRSELAPSLAHLVVGGVRAPQLPPQAAVRLSGLRMTAHRHRFASPSPSPPCHVAGDGSVSRRHPNRVRGTEE